MSFLPSLSSNLFHTFWEVFGSKEDLFEGIGWTLNIPTDKYLLRQASVKQTHQNIAG